MIVGLIKSLSLLCFRRRRAEIIDDLPLLLRPTKHVSGANLNHFESENNRNFSNRTWKEGLDLAFDLVFICEFLFTRWRLLSPALEYQEMISKCKLMKPESRLNALDVFAK
jgi:hypothetical protein